MGLQRDHHTGKNRRQRYHRKRIKTDVDDLPKQKLGIKGRGDAVIKRFGNKFRKFPHAGNKSRQRFAESPQEILQISVTLHRFFLKSVNRDYIKIPQARKQGLFILVTSEDNLVDGRNFKAVETDFGDFHSAEFGRFRFRQTFDFFPGGNQFDRQFDKNRRAGLKTA